MINKYINIVQIIVNQVKMNIMPYRNFMLAYSGGLDSTVLLDVMYLINKSNVFFNKKYNMNFRAVHINHNINVDSSYWTNHCLKECNKRKINLDIINLKITINPKIGLEASLREARYSALSKSLKDGEVLVTAHNKDDQLENIFLSFKRGSSLYGLSLMSFNKKNNHYRILRPLLVFSKKYLLNYANQRQLSWIEDNSNFDLNIDRNFLRHVIIPPIKNRWPKFTNTMLRSIFLCKQQFYLLDELLSHFLKKIINLDKSLKINRLIAINEVFRLSILNKWLILHNVLFISNKLLLILWNEVALSKKDAIPELRIGKHIIYRFKKKLYCLPFKEKMPLKEIKISWLKKINFLKLPFNIGILYKRNINFTLKDVFFCEKFIFYLSKIIFDNRKITVIRHIIRHPHKNEKIFIKFNSILGLQRIINRKHKRSFKKILQEMNIPYWKRREIPLLFYNDTLISALGIFTTLDGIISKYECSFIEILWYKNYHEIFIPDKI